jgi:hypothetical protein
MCRRKSRRVRKVLTSRAAAGPLRPRLSEAAERDDVARELADRRLGVCGGGDECLNGVIQSDIRRLNPGVPSILRASKVAI